MVSAIVFVPVASRHSRFKFREAFLFLFAGRHVRLPSRSLALLARRSGSCLGLFLLRLLLLPIAFLFASGHVGLLWLTTGYHLRATIGWLLLGRRVATSEFGPSRPFRGADLQEWQARGLAFTVIDVET